MHTLFTNRYVKENAEDSTNVCIFSWGSLKHPVSSETAFNKQFLAVISKGCYQLAEGFKHLNVEENHFYQMLENQKKKVETIFRGDNFNLYKSAKKQGRYPMMS